MAGTNDIGAAAIVGRDEPFTRLHPEDLQHLAGLITSQLRPGVGDASLSTHELLTTDEVLRARPGLSREWLYDNAANCRAIRKNKSKRSPYWFRLCDVDAALDAQRLAPVVPIVSKGRARSTVCAHPRRENDTHTMNGAPRAFDIRPRRAA